MATAAVDAEQQFASRNLLWIFRRTPLSFHEATPAGRLIGW